MFMQRRKGRGRGGGGEGEGEGEERRGAKWLEGQRRRGAL